MVKVSSSETSPLMGGGIEPQKHSMISTLMLNTEAVALRCIGSNWEAKHILERVNRLEGSVKLSDDAKGVFSKENSNRLC